MRAKFITKIENYKFGEYACQNTVAMDSLTSKYNESNQVTAGKFQIGIRSCFMSHRGRRGLRK